MTGFKDHFSNIAQAYQRARPSYPDALYDTVCAHVTSRRVAWDCGTGNGQAAVALATRFDWVIATDGSAQQLERAAPHPRIDYRVATAEQSGLAAHSVDLVVAAQAAHWFDMPRFCEEVRRVAVPGGTIAVWCYTRAEIEASLDQVLAEYYWEVAGPYWPPERSHIDGRYGSLYFPFEQIETPALCIELQWSLDHFMHYVESWSAVRRRIEARGDAELPALRAALGRHWGEGARQVRFPIVLQLARL